MKEIKTFLLRLTQIEQGIYGLLFFCQQVLKYVTLFTIKINTFPTKVNLTKFKQISYKIYIFFYLDVRKMCPGCKGPFLKEQRNAVKQQAASYL